MIYSARQIGNAILQKAQERSIPLNHGQLQKFVYFAHVWHLAFYDKPLIDESIKVWPIGPVIENLFHELKAHGNRDIQFMNEMNYDTGELEAMVPNPEDANAWHIVRQIWDRYSTYTTDQMLALTTSEQSPWNQARLQGMRIVSDPVLTQYYRAMVFKKFEQP